MKPNESIELKQHSEFSPGNSLLSPGALLQQGRHELGFTQAEVARRLCLSVKTITAIERDDYKDLHGLSYIRGYLRAYAGLLNISADKVVHALEQQGFVNNIEHTDKQGVAALPHSIHINKEHLTKVASYVFIFAFFVMSFLWWYNHRGLEQKFMGTLDMDIAKLGHHTNYNYKTNDFSLKPDMMFYTTPADSFALNPDDAFGKPYLIN